MNNVFAYISAHKFIFILIPLIVVGGYVYTHQPKISPYETTLVKRGDVVQEVSVTGRVNSSAEVNLAFEKSGRVVSEPRQVGEHVKKDAVLVRLDSSELAALRAQAEANVRFEEANLASIRMGSRPEDIAISRAQVESAQSTLDEAYKAAFDKLHIAYTVSDDAIHNASDQFFRNPKTRNPEVNFPTTDSVLSGALAEGRVLLGEILAAWQKDMQSWNDTSDAGAALADTQNNLNQVKIFLDKLALAINGLAPQSGLTQATIDAWKLDVFSARTNVNTALSNTVSAREKYTSAFAALHVAKNQLALKSVGPTPEAIAAQEAKISGMRASVANYDAQIAKTVLSAPFAGIVTKQDAKLGQTVSPNTPVVTLMSDGKWKIEANVPEADVSKVKVGNSARITFDAYGPEVIFVAKVAMIDPAETIIEGVSTYNVTLYLDQDDNRVRSGMTANIDINTAKSTGVLLVPTRAITAKDDGKKYVRVPSADGLTATEVVVELGLRGSDGYTEIRSGLSEGQRVIIYENTP